MRIAHVAPVIYPVPPETYGGTERVVADLASAQSRLGHDVTVFGPADSRLPGVRMLGEYSSLTAIAAEQGEMPPGFPAELEAEQLGDLVRLARDFDVVHLHGSAHASGVCAGLGVPTFRTIHWRADEPDHIRHFERFPNERVIAISQRQARDVPKANLAGTVHHGIPVDRYRLTNASRDRLVFIGRMTDQKRPDRAIKLAQKAGLPLELAGPVDAGNPDYFRKVVEPYLDSDIRYVGSLTDSEKQAFFEKAVALVFPIDWPEPFGLVMIEAMACGVPVIAWDQGSAGEVVSDGTTGIVVNSMGEAVARLPEVRELSPSTVRRVFEEKYSVERMASEVTNLYQES